MTQYPRKNFSTRYPSLKEKTIEKAMARKEKGIQKYTDQKEASIFLTSSINNAVKYCTETKSWAEMTDEQRKKYLKKTQDFFLKWFLTESIKNTPDKIQEIKEAIITRLQKIEEEAEQEIASQMAEEDEENYYSNNEI